MITLYDQVLYDPISWIHRQRFFLPKMMDNSRCRNILNGMIFDYYKLNMLEVNNNCRLEHMFIVNWQRLHTASFLLCCMRNRSQLARQGGMMALPKFARQFAMLDLPGASLATTDKVGIDDLWLRSGAELLCFRSLLSEGIACRLPLLFSTESVVYAEKSTMITPVVFSLKLALQHVVRNE